MDEPIYVAFSTQKGGAGKTTLTVLVASYLHYVKGYNVAVVDCDFPQYSIHDMRQRDMDAAIKDEHYKMLAYEQFSRLKKKAYPVLCSRSENAPETAEGLTKSGNPPDFIFFDLPGTINSESIVNTLATMDYIFTPIAADRVVMESSVKFASVVNEHLISTGKSNIKVCHCLVRTVNDLPTLNPYPIIERTAIFCLYRFHSWKIRTLGGSDLLEQVVRGSPRQFI